MGHINCLILTLFVKHLPELIKKGKIYMAVPPLFKSKTAKTTKYFYSTEELAAATNKGDVTRFKGIGEMNPQDLWDTTMNPASRKLIQLTTENFEETLVLFDVLMGKSAAARRAFIVRNNELALADDYFGDGEE
jgi:DNA gyrase subunit B